MTRLRKTNRFNYILPLLVIGLLFSIVISVFSAEYYGYIGKISCNFNQSSKLETLELKLYYDSTLAGFIRNLQILAWYGSSTGLIDSAYLAQAQRTRVKIVTDGDVVNSILQLDDPDDIMGMFGGRNLSSVNDIVQDLGFLSAGQSNTLNGIYTNQITNINLGMHSADTTVDNNGLTYFTPIYNQVFNANSNLNNVISAELSTQTSTLSGFKTTLDSIIGRTNTLYSTTLPAINTTIGTMDSYLTTNANSINATLTQHDSLIQNIYNATNATM